MFLGDDANGVAIEVAGVELEPGDLLVVHAMKLRPAYRSRYEQALEYRKIP
jgi:hypothetical protein